MTHTSNRVRLLCFEHVSEGISQLVGIRFCALSEEATSTLEIPSETCSKHNKGTRLLVWVIRERGVSKKHRFLARNLGTQKQMENGAKPFKTCWPGRTDFDVFWNK